jgi:cell wall-associated NlpC family hydrolase
MKPYSLPRFFCNGFVFLAFISLTSCSSLFSSSTSLDRTLTQVKKKKEKEGKRFEYDDVYASRSDVLLSYTPVRVEESPEREPTTSSSARLAKRTNTVLSTARSYLGTPHRIGGMTKRGMDCSGLMVVSFKSIGYELPRSSVEQARKGKAIKISQLKEGDLLFFRDPRSRKVNHVGMVSEIRGENDIRFIHTSTSKGVREDNLFGDYWRKNFVAARRVL